MALSGKAPDMQEMITRRSASSVDISVAMSTIAKAMTESKNIQPNSRLLVMTRSDQIKEFVSDVVGSDGVVFIDPENTTKDTLQRACSSLTGSF